MTTQHTNLPVSDPNDDIDLRVNEYFSTYFSPVLRIGENDYNMIKSFFTERTENVQSAAALIAAAINVINELNLYASDVIEQFRNNDAAVPLFLNMSRQGTSLLGYVQPPTTSENINRQIRS